MTPGMRSWRASGDGIEADVTDARLRRGVAVWAARRGPVPWSEVLCCDRIDEWGLPRRPWSSVMGYEVWLAPAPGGTRYKVTLAGHPDVEDTGVGAVAVAGGTVTIAGEGGRRHALSGIHYRREHA